LKPELATAGVSATIDRSSDSGGRRRVVVDENPAMEISRLCTEIGATRDQLGTYISELDRRRHEALDLKHQLKKHPVLAIGAAVAVIGAVAGAVVMVNRARRHETLGRTGHRKLACFASSSASAPADPAWLLKLVLKAALPLGIAVAKRLLSRSSTRRSSRT
jgi:hypothetical protein